MMPDMFTDLPDLAAERLGGTVIEANDEFFAPKESLLRAAAPEWREGEYTDRGKWMDGWETRRRRTPGHDWAIVKLGAPGIIHGVVIDTSFFTGNFPESASLDGAAVTGDATDAAWVPLLPQSALVGNAANQFRIESSERVTHVRLNIFPDGGVARLRLHGVVVPDPAVFSGAIDLAALMNGGVVLECSDMHYGNRQNLILPGRSTHMGDGWETRRRRGPGHDWTIVRLGRRGRIDRVELDTDHYKGNAPGECDLECCDAGANFDAGTATWQPIVERTSLSADARHHWDIAGSPAATHVRLNVYPDGGVARLRVVGTATP
jgi:allantoicase